MVKFIYFIVLTLIPLQVWLRDNYMFNGNEHKKFEYIGDSWYYWKDRIDIERQRGLELKKILDDIKFTVLVRGQDALAYYADFYEVIENQGLTDKHIAHQKVDKRGRPGHEKSATLEYLRKRKVNFCFDRTPFFDKNDKAIYFKLKTGLSIAEVITFDDRVKQLMEPK